MSRPTSLRTPVRRTLAAVALGLGMVLASLSAAPRVAAQVGGSTPASGTVGPSGGSTTSWAFDPIAGAGSGGTPIEVVCAPGSCSKYALTVKLPAADNAFYHSYVATLTFRCEWSTPTPTDVDCFSFSPSGGETGPGKPDTTATGANFEEIVVNDPQSGDWSLRADAAVGAANNVTGKATLTFAPLAAAPVQAPHIGDPKFANFNFDPIYQTRDGLHRTNAGEPSIGVDWATGKVMYMAGNQVTQLTYNTAKPPVPSALDVTPAISQVNEDAILFTDRETHRTWSLGLLAVGSYAAYSDDDGKNWTPTLLACTICGPDHETLGSGPYHDPAPSHTYTHAVYYCAQTIAQDAYCGRSDDGGMTLGVSGVPLWNGVCSPIHGHIRVGPTGIVYVPNESCTDAHMKARSGVAVSVDNGASFTVSMPPDSSPGTSDPSVMEGPDGTVYFGYQAASGHPMVATATHDANGTLHWKPSIDVGAFQNPGETEDGLPSGVQNTEFSEVITGDPGRAAFAFVGTSRQGAYQAGDFTGTWYLFVSYTFDGGRTWRTVNATPNDPVQRGCVWNGGLVNACRNMLDFNDIGVDKQGHVFVAYTDGCTTSAQYNCDTTTGIHGWNNLTSGDPTTGCSVSELAGAVSTSTCTFGRLSAIVRQVCGRGLTAANDPGFDEGTDCLVPAAITPIIPGAGSPPPSPNTAAGILPYGASMAGVLLVMGAGAGRRRRRRSREK